MLGPSWSGQRFSAATGFRFLRVALAKSVLARPRRVDPLFQPDSSVVTPRVFVVLH